MLYTDMALATLLKLADLKFSMSCPILPTCPIGGLYLNPMAKKWNLWSMDLVLATLKLVDLITTCPIWGLYLTPMAKRRYLWYTNLALTTLERLTDLIIS